MKYGTVTSALIKAQADITQSQTAIAMMLMFGIECPDWANWHMDHIAYRTRQYECFARRVLKLVQLADAPDSLYSVSAGELVKMIMEADEAKRDH